MKKVLVFMAGFLLMAANLYAGSGDLIVDGKLGVGTTIPQAKLHVGDGTTNSSGDIRLEGYSAGNNSYAEIKQWGDNFSIDNTHPQSPNMDFYIRYNGNVGIGTTSPDYKLTVKESSAIGEQLALVALDGNSFVIGTTGANFYIKDKRPAANATRLFLEYDGDIGIGTETPRAKLDVNGGVWANDAPLTSDRKFKKNITPIASALSKVIKIKGVSFEWKTEEYNNKGFSKGKHYGVIAQEIEAVLPEVVRQGSNGDKAVTYTEIIPILIEAIKEQQIEISALKEEQQVMKNQQAMISALFEKVNELEKQVRSEGTVALSDY